MVAYYLPKFVLKESLVTGNLNLGGFWTLSLLSSHDNSLKLNSLVQAPSFTLSEEFVYFSPLFEPSTIIPTSEVKDHVLSFKFKENNDLPRGCPVYSTNLKAQEA